MSQGRHDHHGARAGRAASHDDQRRHGQRGPRHPGHANDRQNGHLRPATPMVGGPSGPTDRVNKLGWSWCTGRHPAHETATRQRVVVVSGRGCGSPAGRRPPVANEGGESILRESIDTSTSVGRMLAGLFASLDEYERELIAERARMARQAAAARGKLPGRPRKPPADKVALALRKRAAGASAPTIAEAMGVSRDTLYRAPPTRPTSHPPTSGLRPPPRTR